MARFSLRFLGVAALVLSSLLTPGAANGVEAGDADPVITGPSGTVVGEGWRGPVSVDFSGAPYGTYGVGVTCGGSALSHEETFNYDGSVTAFTWADLLERGVNDDDATCLVVVNLEAGGAHAEKALTISPLPLKFQDLTQSSPAFYPAIDGYYDTVTFRYNLNRPSNVYLFIKDSTGHLVRKAGPYATANLNHNRGSWSWDGRRSDGQAAVPGTYNVTVQASAADVVRTMTKSVELKQTPLGFESVTRSSPAFYPTVTDGYYDTVTFRYRTNRPANVYVLIKNSDGNLVRKAGPYATSNSNDNNGAWSWNGRRSDGAMAPTGRYNVTLQASASGLIRTVTQPVDLKRSYRVKYASKSRTGSSGALSSDENCFIEGDPDYPDSVLFDSWGGNCVGRYWFAVPSSAYNFTWSSPGSYDDYLDQPWGGGSVTRTGERTSSTRYLITVKVNGWRAWWIDGAYIKYAYKEYY